ncbi:MAG: TonB-dependent receptor [Opitutaceae bacterium]|nr:TonB-dependent receptor [Opitutaceae bacterium]
MNKPLLSAASAAARYGLVALVSTTFAVAQPASTGSSSTTEPPQKLEKFEVTGSRIKRIDTETPQPVVRITDVEFKATGFSTLGDAIRAMPAISGQSLVSIDGGTSFTPGVSSFNLRGLGTNNTLVLINGRRAAPFASAGFNGFQTVFDFNSIPTAAIDSLEVLKDGASAIYGSDAVAGVVNINLKKNYTGLTTELSVGNTLDTDSLEKTAFMIMGAQAGKASVVATMDYSTRKSIYGIDFDYTDESDATPYGGFDQRSSAGPIGAVRGLADRTRFPGGTAYYTAATSNPTLANATPGIPLYNFQQEAGFTPDEEKWGVYTRGVYDFTPMVAGFIEASFRRSHVVIDAAASPYFSSQELGDSPTGAGVFPRTNPYNPFGQDIVDLRYRFTEMGRRIQDSTADYARIVAGLDGRFGNTDWTWDGALVHSKGTVNQLSRNSTSDRLVQNALNGITIEGRRYYLNPFGPNPPELLNYLRITNPGNDSFQVRSADIHASGPIFQLPAGQVGLAVGAEVRTEKFENIGTQLNRDGQIVGGSTGSDVAGDRRLYSYYAELSVPLLKQLEVQAAVRHEQYSDFGETTKPKLAAIFRPIPEVVLRASYGESFLAPNLAFIHTSQSVSFTSNTVADPLRPADPRTQIRTIGGGNRNLQPEETEVVYGGIVLQPFSRRTGSMFRELSFGVDYFKFQQENLINRLSAQQILNDLPAFGHLLVRNPAAPGETVGTISHVLATWQNLTEGEYEGFDFNVRWILPRKEWGEFRTELSATYLRNLEFTTATGALVDYDGEYSFPHLRSTATFAWKRKEWAASLFVQHIGEYLDNFGIARISQQFVLNPQIAYRGWWDSTVTVGVRNVLDKRPPRDLSDSKMVNENVNHVEPAFVYLRWSKEW